MSTDTFTVDENAVKAAAEKSIQVTCDRHGVTRDQLKDEAIKDAYDHARETLTTEAERQADPHYQENQRLKDELRLAKMQLQAMKDRQAPSPQSPNSQLSVDVARARVGEVTWNHKFSNAERLAAIGIEPSFDTAQNRAEAKELFAESGASAKASDLFKRDPGRYRKLREFARATRII